MDINRFYSPWGPGIAMKWNKPSELEQDGMEHEAEELDFNELNEISKQGNWSASSEIPQHGIQQLKDPDLNQFWQSDGPVPHMITIRFNHSVWIKAVSIYLDYQNDESYTPQTIVLKAGTNLHDLEVINQSEFFEPQGWVHLDLGTESRASILCHLIQVSILNNHQNGRDSHLRGLKIWGPKQSNSITIFPLHATSPEILRNSLLR